VALLRALNGDFKASSKKTDAEMKTCFEFATRVDNEHRSRLEDNQSRDLQRHAELREEVHALQAMASNLVTHVQGLALPKPAVSEQASAPALPRDPGSSAPPPYRRLSAGG
jgi:type II secretory pathway component HofQ